MLPKIVKQFLTLCIVLKKAKPLVILLTLLFNLSLSAKIIDTNPNDLPDISVTGDAIVFNSEESSLSDDSSFKKIDAKNQKAEIFISDSTLVYNIEAFSNAKIIKLEKKITLQSVEKANKKPIAAKPENKSHYRIEVDVYYTSHQNSEKFSQNQENKIVVSLYRVQAIAKAVALYVNVIANLFYLSKSQEIIYTNPSIKICYFSGKYSVRPPTFL